MGNEIEAARSRLTDNKQFESYLQVLKNTTNKLLMKRKVDLILSKICTDKITTKDIHIYPNGPILGKIRLKEDAEFWEKDNLVEDPDEYSTDMNLDDKVLTSSPKDWTTAQIIAAQGIIEQFKEKYVKEPSDPKELVTGSKKKYKDPWSTFMFRPFPMENKMDEKISYKTIDDRIKIYKTDQSDVFFGKLCPDENSAKRVPEVVLAPLKGLSLYSKNIVGDKNNRNVEEEKLGNTPINMISKDKDKNNRIDSIVSEVAGAKGANKVGDFDDDGSRPTSKNGISNENILTSENVTKDGCQDSSGTTNENDGRNANGTQEQERKFTEPTIDSDMQLPDSEETKNDTWLPSIKKQTTHLRPLKKLIMGNELGQFQNRMTPENWEFFLTMLKKTTDKLLVKKKVDAFLKDAKFERYPRFDVFDPPAGPSHNVIGRIRPVDRKPTPMPRTKGKNASRKTPASNMAFNFGTGKAKKGIVSPRVLETLPPAWTEESIKLTQENLDKLEAESKLKPPSNVPIDKRIEIRPPKPPDGKEAWTKISHWTVFGYLPNLNVNEAREGVQELTKDLRPIEIDDRAVMFKGQGGVWFGKVLPERQSSRSVFLKREQIVNPTAHPPTEGESPPVTTTSAKREGEGEADDGKKKKRKRKSKKRDLKS